MINLETGQGLFFIMGIPKSGTTWMQMLINSHPDAFCRTEDQFKFLFDNIPKLLSGYNDVIGYADKSTAQQKKLYLYDQNDVVDCYKLLIIRSLIKGNNPAKICLGAKDNGIISQTELFLQMFPQAKFVHVVRNPKDITISSWFHNQRVEENFLDRAGDLGKWAHNVLNRWGNDIITVNKQFEPHPDKLIWVRYEDLLSEPVETLSSVFEFLSLPVDPVQVETIVEKNRFSKQACGREQGKENRDSFFRKGVAGDWKNHLDASTWQSAAHGIADLMIAFLYD